ncbi:MAG TPA: Ku protein [Gemmatimonadales bacterium]|nr:Ku protein [Gemmatimonadales bacterium]
MPPRAIWSGAISFGMVTIPVKLYSATHSKDIAFNLLHATDGARIEQKRFCSVEQVEVPWDHVVRGYRYAKDQYVTLTDEDFENLPLPSKHKAVVTSPPPREMPVIDIAERLARSVAAARKAG